MICLKGVRACGRDDEQAEPLEMCEEPVDKPGGNLLQIVSYTHLPALNLTPLLPEGGRNSLEKLQGQRLWVRGHQARQE